MKKQIFFLLLLVLATGQMRAQLPDIVSVKSPDVFLATKQAVASLGGMERFVKPGQTVGILVNSGFRDKGCYVDPDVVIATLEMVFQAGASDVVFLQHILPEYWERSNLEPQYREMIARARTIETNHFPSVYNEEVFVKMESVEGASVLSNLEIVREFMEVDVFINIPIAKNHTLTTLTNAMKNLMGINTRASNVTFHLNGPARNDPQYLAQSIAELNLLRPSDLIISDVTTVLITNGPSGPGENIEPGRVVAATDLVAVDVYCAGLVGFMVEDVLSVEEGYKLGLGEKDLHKLRILELELDGSSTSR